MNSSSVPPSQNGRRDAGWFARSAVLVTPLALLATWAVVIAAKGPYWLGTNLDPDYAYLLNGLGLLRGQVPAHVDHPGTPVQLVVAAVIGVVHLATGSGPVDGDVLGRPEFFLATTNFVLLALFAGSLVVAGVATLRATGSLAAALAIEIIPGLSPTVALNVACVKPEPVLGTLAALVSAVAIARIDPERRREPARDAVLFGVLVGLAIATKISAAPLAVLPLLALRGRAALSWFIGATLVTAAAITVPAWPALEGFAIFVSRIARHSGHYGAGKESILDLREYAEGLTRLGGTDDRLPLLVLAVGLAIAGLLARTARSGRVSGMGPTLRTLVAGLATILASYLVVARHAAGHYLLPALVVTGLVAALSIHGARALLPEEERVRRPALLVIGALVGLVGVLLGSGTAREMARLDSQRKDQLEIVQRVEERGARVPVVNYYRSSSIAYALHFGDVYARSTLAPQIAARHPGHVFYNIWNGRIEGWRSDPKTPGNVRVVHVKPTVQLLCGNDGGEPVLFQGSPVDGRPPVLPGSERPGILLEVVDSRGVEAIYRPAGCPQGEKAGHP